MMQKRHQIQEQPGWAEGGSDVIAVSAAAPKDKAAANRMAEIPWEQRLRAAGERLTPQRLLIASILQERGGHLGADEIYDLARDRYPRLSLATVYRTLRWLKESGLVHELRLNGDRYRYEIKPHEPHQHMVCLNCGKVIEFTCDHCAEVHKDLADKHGFRITGARVKLLGYCVDCQARAHNSAS
jgi:Fur family ferric uptake transcriptional regulator